MTASQTPLPSLSTIAIPLVPRMIATSITLPLEMLEAARAYCALTHHHKTLKIILCAETLSPVKTTGGLMLTPDTCYHDTGQADLILVPALWRNPIPQVRRHTALLRWLRQQQSGQPFFAVGGTGVTFLAEAGLLNNQPATTHWFYLKRLQHQYPLVHFKPHHLMTCSNRIYCAGSVNSMADLMVHIIKLTMGSTVAAKVEQQFSHEIRKSFEDNGFTEKDARAHQDESVIQLQEWLDINYASAITLKTMTDYTGLHPRTLSRRFKQATTCTPMVYLAHCRIRQAKALLKDSNLGIADIGMMVGINDPDYFSRLFFKHCQITPSNYKKSVREKLFHINKAEFSPGQGGSV
ncbi:GlxA family transcriptional regulator [Candidatus Sororendozoicomonas aggregata]|uniref:GlxA family transcriptional regulator n=1 Tax=Candidatus Sororendozoicomonas aggregata TaxID=3073239 RepID=UPI002ED62316